MEQFHRFDRLTEGYSALLVGPQAWALSEAKRLGVEFLSTEALVRQRMELGPYHQISWTGSRLTDSFLYWEGCYFLVKARSLSPLYDSFSQEHHELDEEVPFEAVVDGPDFIMVPQESFDVPAGELAQDPISAFLLGSAAEEYGAWLQACSIPSLPFTVPPKSLVRHHPGPFIRPLVMRCTDNWSGLVAVNDLHHPYGARGFAPALPPGVEDPEEERYSAEALVRLAPVLSLEARAYSLSELQAHAEKFAVLPLLGVALRVLRGGSSLPVSHATFAPEASHG